MRYPVWTKEELETIKKHFKKIPREKLISKLQEELPERKLNSIRRKVRELFGLKDKIYTKEEDDIIKEVYRCNSQRKIGNILKHRLPHRTRHSIYCRAFSLGVTGVPWNKEEIELIQKSLDRFDLKSIQNMLKARGYNKTESSIKNFIYKQGWSRKLDVYSASEASIGLGVSWNRMNDWIKKGYLKAEKNGGGIYKIKPNDIAQFIRQYPYEVNNGKPDIPWIVALLDEFKKDKTNGT